MTEKQLQAAVIELAGYLKWKTYHTYDSRRSAAGFPDLVLVRDRILFVELKTAKGKLSAYQQAWIDDLDRVAVEGSEVVVYVWRPVHWTNGEIEEVLT